MKYVIFYYLNKDSIIILNIRINIFINWLKKFNSNLIDNVT